MSKQEYDPGKLLKVAIDRVCVNSWNPKEENTPEFQKIVQSIKQKGLRGAVVTRNHQYTEGMYEILDGQQRYTAAKLLGYKDIWIYNEGNVGDKEARELTIWYQQQVPFNRITEAYLVTQMADDFGIETLELPYSEKEFTDFKELATFDFEQYKESQKVTENLDGTVTFSVKLSKEDYEIIRSAVDDYAESNQVDKAKALVLLIKESVNV